MALKGDFQVVEWEPTFTCASVASPGAVLCHKTAGSGIALGDSRGIADLYADPSGKVPVGLLFGEVVNVDQTLYHRNFHKNQTQINEPVAMIRKGTVTTNMLAAVSPTAGSTAYLGADGKLTSTMSATGGLVATPKVGQFLSIKDENGYIRVHIDIPVV